MEAILKILEAMSDSSRSLLLCGDKFDPYYVNHKKGPSVTPKTFRLLKEQGFIKALNRVQYVEGPWYAITPEGKDFLKTCQKESKVELSGNSR